MTVIRDVMSTDLTIVAPSTTIADAATMMSTRQVGSALVLDGDRLSASSPSVTSCARSAPTSTPSITR